MDRRTVLAGIGGVAALGMAPPSWAQGGQGRWLRLESANFVLFSAMNEKKSREEIVALERFHALLTKLMPRETRSAMKLEVYIAGSDKDFEHVHPGARKDVAGFYSSRIEDIKAVTAPHRAVERQGAMQRDIRAMDARVILFHEYVHHFVRANTRITYPDWYNEGFAEFLSTADLTEKEVVVGKFTANRAIWLSNGNWMNIQTFLGVKDDLSREESAMFYAQAWLAAHYLFMTPNRAEGMDKYCAAIQTGADPVAAFEPAFGITPQDFDKELKAYKRKSVRFLRIPEDVKDHGAEVKVTRLSQAADNLLLAHSYLRSVPRLEKAAGTLSHIRSEAKRHAADPFAMRAAAATEVWYGDLAEARKQIDALLVLQATDAETHHLSGLCDLRLAYRNNDPALARKARGAFTAAHRIDDTRASSLFRYVECDFVLEKAFSAHMAEVLLAAYRLAPQIDVLTLVTAQALLQFEKWPDVEFVLRPLASSVHSPELVKVAQGYLAAAKAQTKPSVTFYGSADALEFGVFEDDDDD